MALLKLDTYTGQLNYKDILFTFIFDGSELRLIPPADKSSEIEFNWILTPIGEGTYTSASPQMESPFLTEPDNAVKLVEPSFLLLRKVPTSEVIILF